MKYLLTLLILTFSLLAQSNPNNITLNASGPPLMPSNAINISITGNTGHTVRSIWIVVNYPIGSPGVSGPYTFTNEPSPLNVSNYVTISWPCQANAISYDILKTKPGEPTPLPGNTYTYALSTGQVACNLVDQGITRTSYTVPVPVPQATGQMILDNQDLSYPYIYFSVPVIGAGSGGGGTITNVAGTTNQVCTVVNGSTTTISLCNPEIVPGPLSATTLQSGTLGEVGGTHYYDASGVDTLISTATTASGLLFVNSNPILIGANNSFNNAQTAAITTTAACTDTGLTDCGIAGIYFVDFSFWGVAPACSDVTAGSVRLNLTWTDISGGVHTTIPLPMWDQKAGSLGTAFNFNTSVTTEGASGHYVISSNGLAPINFATTYTACTTGTGTYSLYIWVTRI